MYARIFKSICKNVKCENSNKYKNCHKCEKKIFAKCKKVTSNVMETISIFHSCEVRTEISASSVTVWHHEALPSDENVTREKESSVRTEKLW